MTSFEVIRRAVDIVGAKKVAVRLKVSTSLVYKWCQPSKSEDNLDASGAVNPLDRVAGLWACTEDVHPIDWLCRRAGGTFVPDPETDGNIDTAYVERTQNIVKRFSELLTTVSESIIDDGCVDEKEADHIRSQWQELKRHGESFTVACERGLFGGPRPSP
jgi:hypothetical protein